MKTVDQLREELKAAEQAEAAERNALHASIKPVWQYTVEPSSSKGYSEIWDDTIVFFTLAGRIVNEDELRPIGWSDSELRHGSMNYMFNTGTGKLVCSFGGGTIYISSWDSRNRSAERAAIEQLSKFIVDHPEGGDVTAIVNAFQAAKQ